MKRRGINEVQVLSPSTAGAPPAIYGEVLIPGATRTLIFYAHYDGQPVNPDQWATGLQPFKPQLLNGTLEKNASIIPFLSASGKYDPEGEEESGSDHLHEILQKHSSLLQSDMWIICDGPVHQSGKKQVVFGVRGDTHVELTVYASNRPLHSGHYGNWSPNPEMMLAKLFAESINLPSLNINGMQSANVGKLASYVIPTTATATIDLRLVMVMIVLQVFL